MRAQQWMSAASICVVLVAVSGTLAFAQAPAGEPLASAQALKCSFTLMATGTWDKGTPNADITKSTLSMQFEAIDTQDGTANVTGVSSSSEGAPHLTVRLLGDNLHFLAMNVSGSVYLTTVFADKESKSGASYKAVHTRHEFTAVRLTGWTSRPEQYYGYCEAKK